MEKDMDIHSFGELNLPIEEGYVDKTEMDI